MSKDSLNGIEVRTAQEIPSCVFDFVRQGPKTKQGPQTKEQLLPAQVLMHEIDEGTRLLKQANRYQEAEMISDFTNKMHLSNRIELLRTLLLKPEMQHQNPEETSHLYKVRNNQIGAIKLRIGPHPCLAVSSVGLRNPRNNQDAFLIMPRHKLIALSDGMGGHHGGQIASCVAIDFFEHLVHHGADMPSAIAASNKAILLRSQSDPLLGGQQPMGCTFASVELRHNRLQVVHIGDTKVMILRKGAPCFQTEDHTRGQRLFGHGLIDGKTAFKLNHILHRCLGLNEVFVDRDLATTQILLQPGDRVLLATDGVTDNFYNKDFDLDELVDIACTGPLSQSASTIMDTSLERMRSKTLENGRAPKRDNITLAMFEFRP